jgi:YggT family protein
MFVIRDLLQVVIFAIDIYWWVIIAAAIVSWLIAFKVINTYNQAVRVAADMLYRATEPALRPIRRFMPNLGGLDISPVILLLILYFIRLILLDLVLQLYGM